MTTLSERAQLHDKTAVVIGGAGGIGQAVTLALAREGVNIALCDLDGNGVAQTRSLLAELGIRWLAEIADATVPEQLAEFYRAVAATFPAVDILVNVAGGTLLTPFADMTPERCAQDIQRNYGYVLESIRHALPLIRQGGKGGTIVSFTTIEAHRGAAGFSVYAGAKAATTNFSRALACELGPEKIRVNVIAPDTTPSQGNIDALPPALRDQEGTISPEQWADILSMYIPLAQPPSVEDLADAVLFLASALSRSITGQVLHVDGGTSASLGFMRWPLDGVWLPVPGHKTAKKLLAP